ncbi:hypothetical protein E4U55_002214 [Claviceps digitariae]|nr:hypothetical protein E4U55_002214 [Claviceps digitariae]
MSQCRPQGKRKPAKQYGLYVPDTIFEKVMSQYDERKAKEEDEWSRKLDKEYPHMPLKDKIEIRRRCASEYLSSKSNTPDVRRYVLDQYTAFKPSLITFPITKLMEETAAKAHREVDRILLTWRGKDPAK